MKFLSERYLGQVTKSHYALTITMSDQEGLWQH
jgi:hypothetical protein